MRRLTGKLESFDQTNYHAFVRIRDTKVHLSASIRGVLESGSIRPCTEDERAAKISPETLIAVEVTLCPKEQKLMPTAWAPKK